ncbi:amino acid permease [Saccharothrix sp.]|uniref:APC family permease n=1 Tax=Saccharothrix sp. TaxID=1873460 RepID=UPI0028118DB8|nr:amino acid permease [Saccharothrix sp.]
MRLTAMYLGAVLGPGVLVLPALATGKAGPASILAWVLLLALSVPVAMSFAELGTRYPGGHGVAGFVGQAFGPRAQRTVAWWFCAVGVPVGVLGGALVGGQYVAHAAGGPPLVWGTLILVAAFAANHAGLRVSATVQVLLVGLLTALVATAIAFQAPHVTADDFRPFAPHGWLAVGTAATVLFFAFAGWEAASHLSGEFPDPKRATRRTLGVVAVLYLGLAVTTVAVPGDVPLAVPLERAFGPSARVVTAVAAVLLSFGAVNTYVAGAVQLGTAMGVKRSLAVQAGWCAVLLVVTAVWQIDLDTLMGVTATTLAAVTAAGMAAAVKLLPRKAPPAVALAFTLVVLGFSGWWLLVPVLVSALAWSVAPAGRSAASPGPPC